MMEFDGYTLGERAALAAMGYREQTKPRVPMKINPTALAGARAQRRTEPSPMAMDTESIFAAYKPLPAVLPDGMAMDACMPPQMAGVTSWATSGLYHEGQGFFGYPYLAELIQRAEYRHAAEIWAEHSVRKWITFTGGTSEKIAQLEEEFNRLEVRDRVQEWIFHDHSFGRGQMFMDFGDADHPAEIATPLSLTPGKINPRRPLKALTVVEPMWSMPGLYATTNPLRSDFYKPTQWLVFGRRVHASRMLTLTSRPVSDMLKPAYAFGGQSLTQLMKPYVDNWLRSRQAVSDMLNSYSIINLRTDMASVLGGGSADSLYDRADMFVMTRDNRGMMLTDKAMEELQSLAVPLSGLSDLLGQSQEQLASAARIPLSIYLQITPTGLNSTSDGETRNFYADVLAYNQKNVRLPLYKILAAVQLSLWGEVDTTIGIRFEPLWEMDEKDKALIRKSDADAHNIYVAMGAVSNEEVREVLENNEDGLYHGIDLSGPAPEPEEDETDTTKGDDK